MENKAKINFNIGIVDVVQINLIMFKIFHVIDWPWHKVLIPLWATIAFTILILAVYGLNNLKEEEDD